jgi:Alpha/beta hydrolase domain
VEDGTLVTVDDARAAFPTIPGMRFPESPNPLEQLNYGPEFSRHGGVITNHPPLPSGRYPVLVPKADRDGFDLAGIRLVQVRAPLGTTTGWNVRTAQARSNDLCGLSGSYVPFARSAAERTASGDSRKSLEERYGTHQGFVEAVEKASRQLVNDRFLDPEDAERYVAAARASDVLR